ncbi:[citrate (pro-3S)-lyase] ligase [Streptococcus castoreus]|uniref:[citrate (pro-3S)-lyase] ligase n=1 Tax=Streptococcus castoreus TaxID=254786 RepID=UPI0004001F2E|nr:[citrate (pro-3S)-lyase] ligase [Streptococcus castoreus]
MSTYTIERVFPFDQKRMKLIDKLLADQQIRRDPNLDYSCVLLDENRQIIATGSLFQNSLRCLAISQKYQGVGLLNKLVSHLVEEAYSRGYYHLFIYTKIVAANWFKGLGFYEIAHIGEELSFLENRQTGFADYLTQLENPSIVGNRIAAVVLNANPFTLGHLHLVEKACAENDWVHLFCVSQDSSLIPYQVRKELIKKGTRHLSNITYHDTGSYMISQATFPSYFQKNDLTVIDSQARLDTVIFTKIARSLNVTDRYVGEEPTSLVTQRYNLIMTNELPKQGITLHVIPRKTDTHGEIISASLVRQALKDGNNQLLEQFLPKTSFDFFNSAAAEPIIAIIKATTDVHHY